MDSRPDSEIYRSSRFLCITVLTIVLGLACGYGFSQAPIISKKYLQIKTALENRQDVESRYGLPKENGHHVTYQLSKYTIDIGYSYGDCSYAGGAWAIAEWRVEDVSYYPRSTEKVKLRDVILDPSKFKKRQVSDVLSHIEYYNEEYGITVVYDTSEKRVVGIIVKLTTAQKKEFACPQGK